MKAASSQTNNGTQSWVQETSAYLFEQVGEIVVLSKGTVLIGPNTHVWRFPEVGHGPENRCGQYMFRGSESQAQKYLSHYRRGQARC